MRISAVSLKHYYLMNVILLFLLAHSALAAPQQTANWIGSNYTPAYACNQVQFWHDFRPAIVEAELAAAREYFGITSLRVYLHSINFEEDREAFFENLEKFLAICARHEIRPGFCFFDDCHRHEGIYLDRPTEPVKGYHNGRWAACPQDRDRNPENLERFKPYIQEVIRAHLKDPRVRFWEIFNEPRREEYSHALRQEGYAWAKELQPIAPVISCWDDNEATDIVDAHNYSVNFGRWDRQIAINPEKGCVFTEAGARWYALRPSNGEPCEVIDWLERRRAAGQYVPGVFLCWELMVGNSNCRWYWGTPEGAAEPTVPWCGLLWPDATPVSLAEAYAVRSYATGKSDALFFDGFQDAPAAQRPGWKSYGPGAGGSRVLEVPAGVKMVAGSEDWTDYVLEAVVMLDGETGNAGLIFRVNDPADGNDQFVGYYAGIDTKKLHLGRMDHGRWTPLAEYDLSQLDCQVKPDVWNQIRVAVNGNRIRVWLNRMHPSSDPDSSPRIDYTDDRQPILSGAIGVRAHRVGAKFDNVIALPIESLPQPRLTADGTKIEE